MRRRPEAPLPGDPGRLNNPLTALRSTAPLTAYGASPMAPEGALARRFFSNPKPQKFPAPGTFFHISTIDRISQISGKFMLNKCPPSPYNVPGSV